MSGDDYMEDEEQKRIILDQIIAKLDETQINKLIEWLQDEDNCLFLPG
jgi:hypothetical protein